MCVCDGWVVSFVVGLRKEVWVLVVLVGSLDMLDLGWLKVREDRYGSRLSGYRPETILRLNRGGACCGLRKEV